MPDEVKLVAVALAKVLRPETVSAVAEALLNVLCPGAYRLEVTVRLVDEALLNDAVEVEVILPATSDDPVALSKKSEER